MRPEVETQPWAAVISPRILSPSLMPKPLQTVTPSRILKQANGSFPPNSQTSHNLSNALRKEPPPQTFLIRRCRPRFGTGSPPSTKVLRSRSSTPAPPPRTLPITALTPLTQTSTLRARPLRTTRAAVRIWKKYVVCLAVIARVASEKSRLRRT